MNTLDLTEQYVTALTQGDVSAMQALWSDDFVLDWVHGDAFEDTLSSREDMAQFWPAWLAGFPEYDFEITRSILSETVSVVQWIFSGTHQRPIPPPVFAEPLPPTNRTIRLRGVSFYDITAGKISKETTYLDLATLYVELGVDVG